MFAPATGENTEKVVFVFYDRREDPGSRMGRKETVFQTGGGFFPHWNLSMPLQSIEHISKYFHLGLALWIFMRYNVGRPNTLPIARVGVKNGPVC